MTLSDFRLSRGQRRTAEALAFVVCPNDLAELGIVDDVVEEVELMLRSFPGLARFGLVASLVALEWLAVLAPSSLGRPFTRLPRARKERWFARLWSSPLALVRQMVKTLKGLLTMGYYEHPKVKARLAYHPDQWIAEVARERLARFGSEIRIHEAQVTAPDPLVPAKRLTKRNVDEA